MDVRYRVTDASYTVTDVRYTVMDVRYTVRDLTSFGYTVGDAEVLGEELVGLHTKG